MTLTSVPCQVLFLALSVVAVEFTAASHFRGAIIQWKPVDPVKFDGRVSRGCRSVTKSRNSCVRYRSALQKQYINNKSLSLSI